MKVILRGSLAADPSDRVVSLTEGPGRVTSSAEGLPGRATFFGRRCEVMPSHEDFGLRVHPCEVVPSHEDFGLRVLWCEVVPMFINQAYCGTRSSGPWWSQAEFDHDMSVAPFASEL